MPPRRVSRVSRLRDAPSASRRLVVLVLALRLLESTSVRPSVKSLVAAAASMTDVAEDMAEATAVMTLTAAVEVELEDIVDIAMTVVTTGAMIVATIVATTVATVRIVDMIAATVAERLADVTTVAANAMRALPVAAVPPTTAVVLATKENATTAPAIATLALATLLRRLGTPTQLLVVMAASPMAPVKLGEPTTR